MIMTDFIDDIQNKNIVVTGASSGIGRATCLRLSQLGANVIMIARREAELKKTYEMMSGENHKYYVFDLSELDKIDELVTSIVAENGKLDGLVHCAGYGPTRPLKVTTPTFMDEIMALNCLAFVELGRSYSKRRNNNAGSIVAISSMASLKGDKGKIAYCTSKSALDSAVRSMAVELKTKRIRVNSIQPGWVKTEMYNEYIKTAGKEVSQSIGMSLKNTLVAPEEIANLVVFLLSNTSSAVSGASIIANAIGI